MAAVATAERTREILKGLVDSVLNYEEEKAVALAHAALDEGVDPHAAVMDGIAAGMIQAGELYNQQVYYVPELMMCADALYSALEILKPAVVASGRKAEVKGSIVIGVVEGDVHDIGKNLVKLMFDVAGWTVYDLGKDVPVGRFMEEQQKTGADVVAMSALMTTSMLAMPKAIEMVKAKNSNALTMIGGAPINPDVAKKFGADGYAKSAGTAVDEAIRLIDMARERVR